ncbi:MAG: CotH kinase family protein [Melioribacteraceae bacterium]|nr:CotH kinase family protein [Melioribacteraceae bacterium]MCF8265279.1 CotH kinase family protein [Melioribacteraceae bacterium]MCF8431510.1 CotH kinase family protein [Melioribacteraceae bacterium]
MKLIPLYILFFTAQILSAQNDESTFVFDDSQITEIRILVDSSIVEYLFDSRNAQSDSMHYCSISFKNRLINEKVDSVGIRLRGNTSRNSAKKSFKLSFNTFKNGGEFYGLEKLNINGEHNDPSIVRAKLSWDLFEEIGMIAPRSNHVALYINNRYYGLYINVEHIDEVFVERNYEDYKGNLWKCLYQNTPANLKYLGNNLSSYEHSYALKTNREDYDYTRLMQLIEISNSQSNQIFKDGIEEILNTKEFLQYLAMNLLLGSWDDYRYIHNNYYLYFDPGQQKIRWIPYDYDNTFGIDWFGEDWALVDPYNYPIFNRTEQPLSDKLLKIPEYKNLYTHFIEFYNSAVFDLSLWQDRIDTLKSLITPFAEIDEIRQLDYGFTSSDFHNSFTDGFYSNQHVKRGIKSFIKNRNSSVKQQLKYEAAKPTVYEFNYEPKIPGPNDSIYVYASIYSSSDLTKQVVEYNPGLLTVVEEYQLEWKPIQNSKLVEENDRYLAVIPPIGEGGFGNFRIMLKNSDGFETRYPADDFINITAPEIIEEGLKINEFLASNNSGIIDENGLNEDWIELYNNSSEAIPLFGIYLTDDPANNTKWQFTANDTLAPGSFLTLWADDDEEEGLYHTNFRLDKDGEFIAIYSGDGITVLDSISFGSQSDDISFGRTPDGSNTWNFLTPSPGEPNLITSAKTGLLPTSFDVAVYPNPFNPETNIQFSLTSPGLVEFRLFNVLGESIFEHQNIYESAGTFTFRLNLNSSEFSNLSSGMYFLNVTNQRNSKFLKLIYLK